MNKVEKSIIPFSRVSKKDIAARRRTNALIETVETNTPPRLITRHELAIHYKVTPRTLINWQKRGLLIPIKIGGKIFYELSAVLELQNSNK